MKRQRIMISLLISLFILPFQLFAQPISLTKMSNHTLGHQWQFAFYLTKATKYRSFTLKNPDRFVLDLKNVKTKYRIRYKPLIGTPIRAVRFSPHKDGIFRVVFDLDMAVNATVSEAVASKSSDHKLQVLFTRSAHHVAAFDWPLKGTVKTASNKPDLLRETNQGGILKKKVIITS